MSALSHLLLRENACPSTISAMWNKYMCVCAFCFFNLVFFFKKAGLATPRSSGRAREGARPLVTEMLPACVPACVSPWCPTTVSHHDTSPAFSMPEALRPSS